MAITERQRDEKGRFLKADAPRVVDNRASAAQDEKPKRPPLAEIATFESDHELGFGLDWLGYQMNPDPVNAEHRSKVAAYQYDEGIYDEVLDLFWHFRSVMEQRVSAVLAAPRRIRPFDGSGRAMETRDLVEAVLGNITGFEGDLRALLYSSFYSRAYLEVMPLLMPSFSVPRGGVTPRGQRRREGHSEVQKRGETVVIESLRSRRPGRFVYGTDNELRILTRNNQPKGEPVPQRKFIEFVPETRWENPYGVGLGRTVYWAFILVTRTLRYWAIFAEKYAQPTPVLIHSSGATKEEKAAYKRIVTSFQRETGITLPVKTKDDPLELKLLEPERNSTVNTFKELLEFLQGEISKLVVMQTMTTEDGSSRSQAQVHYEVRADIIRRDAQSLCGCLNDSLIRWIVDWNFGADHGLYPFMEIDSDPAADVDLAIKRYDFLFKHRLPVDLEEVYDELGATMPEPGSEHEFIYEPLPPPELGDGDDTPPSGGGKAPGKPKDGAKDSGKGKEAGDGAKAALQASLDDKHQSSQTAGLHREGLAKCSRILSPLPGQVEKHLARACERAFGEGWQETVIGEAEAEQLASAMLDFEFDSVMVKRFRDRLNDDLTIATLYGRGQVLDLVDSEDKAALSLVLPLLARRAPSDNPLIEELFGEKRIIPRRVLSVFTRKTFDSLTYEQFYRLDSVARGASFTAWDLCEADVRDIGGALQDAIRNGWTSQKFSRHVRDVIKAAYVQQEGEPFPWHLDTIYHVNLATAYNHAQADQIDEMAEDFPYFQIINPDPEHPRCVECAGQVWETSRLRSIGVPPWHFGCGTTLAALTELGLERRGLKVQLSMPINPPDSYSGPRDPKTGQRIGTPQPFGGWAPLSERYESLRKQREAA